MCSKFPYTFHSGPCNPKPVPAHRHTQLHELTDSILSAYPAHLIVVSEVTDPHVLVHVGVVEVFPEPADITPVEIPLPFTGGEVRQRS